METTGTLRLDAADAIVHASQGWLEAASRDTGLPLTEASVLGRPFADFAPDPDMAPVYELVFKRVRQSGQVMRVPYRQDTKDERRYMEMEVAPQADGSIECHLHTMLVHKRPAVVPDGHGNRLLSVCGWCRKVKMADGTWEELEAAAERLALFLGPAPRLSHGLCPSCEVGMRQELAVAR